MRLAWLVTFASAVFGQIGGPSLGLVADGAQIRAMYGMPAAGAVGPAVADGLKNIAISPSQNYALAVDANGSTVLVLPSGAISAVAGTSPDAARMAISPTGSAAALWIPAASRFEIVTGLPASPGVRHVDEAVFGAPLAFAVSDSGRAAASFANGVQIFAEDGSVAPVALAGRALALGFFPNSQNFAITTGASVISVNAGTASVMYQETPAARQHVREPAGIAVSSDGRWIASAMSDGAIVAIDTSSGAASTFDCECVPAGVFAMSGSVFRLTNPSIRGGVKLLDASSGNVYDVPRAAGGGE